MKGYLVLSLIESLQVGGADTKIQNEGLLGVLPVFDTYERALYWADGNAQLVKQISKVPQPEAGKEGQG